MNLAQLALAHGGSVKQLILPVQDTQGMGVMNPSVFIDGDRTLVNIRVLNYILYHSESQKFYHIYGPLQYIHPDADPFLRTTNYLAELDDNLDIIKYSKIDTSSFDVTPVWEFVGLEDGRLFKHEDKLFLTGVRRDTTTHGQGRMELSEIKEIDGKVMEVSRVRIPAPEPDLTYCEKNWAIVLGRETPTYVKWHNPLEVVEYKDGKTTQLLVKDCNFETSADLRGSSQVIPFEDGYVSIVHEVYLFQSELGSKNARYRHRIVFYDKDLNITSVSTKPFSFMDSEIEFCCGMAIKDDDVLITFGFQDNSAFILKMPKGCLHDTRFN